MVFIRLFFEFFKTGLFSIGGGMATIPFLQTMSVKTDWFSIEDLVDMIAIAESTPGPIGINMATYVGYTVGNIEFGVLGGLIGGIMAVIGLVTPSIIIISIIANFLVKFRESKYVEASFYGLRPASVGLISAAGVHIILMSFFGINSIYSVFNEIKFDLRHLLLAVTLFIFLEKVPVTKKMHPLFFIVISAIAGIVFRF
jgi:chromate transporter